MILSFFFSTSETSIIGLSKIKLKHMIAKGIRGALRIQYLVTNLDKFIVGILVGNNFVNIAISSIVTVSFVHIFGNNWGIVIATFTTATFVLILCEILPKLLAVKHTEKIALFTAPVMELVIRLLHPLIIIFNGTSNFILRLLHIKPTKRSPLVTEEELRLMIEVGKEEGVLSEEERKMLHRIFEFGDMHLSEVMVPKDKIIAVNINATSDDLLNIFVEEGHARLPVYENSIDNIVGIIYARDLLYILRDKSLFLLPDLLHPAYFTSASTRVNELLKKFQQDRLQIAIVVDEHKKTQGLVTLEDLIEEIVGEIEEEYK
jgi:CBS domain containing-hemolysin-like protein